MGDPISPQGGDEQERVGDLGERLRRQRVAAGLTQEDLARRSGLSVRAISDMERGRTRRPRRSTLSQIFSALDAARAEPGLAESARAEPGLAGLQRPAGQAS
jgi:transcriptional regulator with XRE-family HTH domain